MSDFFLKVTVLTKRKFWWQTQTSDFKTRVKVWCSILSFSLIIFCNWILITVCFVRKMSDPPPLSSSVTQMMLSSDWCTDVRDIILFLTSSQSTESLSSATETLFWGRTVVEESNQEKVPLPGKFLGSWKWFCKRFCGGERVYQTSSRSVRAAFRSHHRWLVNMLESLQMFV